MQVFYGRNSACTHCTHCTRSVRRSPCQRCWRRVSIVSISSTDVTCASRAEGPSPVGNGNEYRELSIRCPGLAAQSGVFATVWVSAISGERHAEVRGV